MYARPDDHEGDDGGDYGDGDHCESRDLDHLENETFREGVIIIITIQANHHHHHHQ